MMQSETSADQSWTLQSISSELHLPKPRSFSEGDLPAARITSSYLNVPRNPLHASANATENIVASPAAAGNGSLADRTAAGESGLGHRLIKILGGGLLIATGVALLIASGGLLSPLPPLIFAAILIVAGVGGIGWGLAPVREHPRENAGTTDPPIAPLPTNLHRVKCKPPKKHKKFPILKTKTELPILIDRDSSLTSSGDNHANTKPKRHDHHSFGDPL